MAILTKIGNIPLFTSTGEALAWARKNFVQGYHTHTYRGKVGYMGGKTHSMAVSRRINAANSIAPQSSPIQQVAPPTPTVQQQSSPQTPTTQQIPTPQPVQINYGSGGSSSGGGGGY